MQFALRELSTIIRAPRLWGTFFVVVLIFTVTGPFGTDQSMPVAVRFFTGSRCSFPVGPPQSPFPFWRMLSLHHFSSMPLPA